MKLTSHTPHKKARIEIIPLIDIMFFLLASFMLVAMSMVKLQAIQTRTCPSRPPPRTPVKKPDFVAIGVDKDGPILFRQGQDAYRSATTSRAACNPFTRRRAMT